MPFESGVLSTIIAKIGWAKVATLGTALVGAGIMAAFRPPKSRKEMALQALVALGSSFLFGDVCVAIANSWMALGNEWDMPINGLVGALSWGIFGGIAHYRDHLSEQSIVESVHEVEHPLEAHEEH